jgi:glycine/D-amino acid oxidase-like deaminating enzyme
VSVSYWLEDAGDDPTPRPPLDGSRTVDVAIVGAGFTGLWTARELLRRDPSLEVLVLEAETAGFGASGRNGAWLTNGIGVTPGELARRTSPATARATIEAMRATVAAVIASCEEDGIDAQIRRGGALRVARGAHEAPGPAGRDGHDAPARGRRRPHAADRHGTGRPDPRSRGRWARCTTRTPRRSTRAGWCGASPGGSRRSGRRSRRARRSRR